MPFLDDIGFDPSGPDDFAGEEIGRTNAQIFKNLSKGKVEFGGTGQNFESKSLVDELAPRSSGEPEVRKAQSVKAPQPVTTGPATLGIGGDAGLGALPSSSRGTLAQMRQPFFQELSDPETRRLLYASTQAEVGDQGEQAKQAYIESVMNRASATGKTLREVLLDPGYYPQSTKSQLGRQFSAGQAAEYNAIISSVLGGSNISSLATGNESGSVHSGGAAVTYDPGSGERFVAEGWTTGWRDALEQGLGGALPAYASGGIVTEPTVALVGEKGPEAIVPLRAESVDQSYVLRQLQRAIDAAYATSASSELPGTQSFWRDTLLYSPLEKRYIPGEGERGTYSDTGELAQPPSDPEAWRNWDLRARTGNEAFWNWLEKTRTEMGRDELSQPTVPGTQDIPLQVPPYKSQEGDVLFDLETRHRLQEQGINPDFDSRFRL